MAALPKLSRLPRLPRAIKPLPSSLQLARRGRPPNPNRHKHGLEIVATPCKQRRKDFLIATDSGRIFLVFYLFSRPSRAFFRSAAPCLPVLMAGSTQPCFSPRRFSPCLRDSVANRDSCLSPHSPALSEVEGPLYTRHCLPQSQLGWIKLSRKSLKTKNRNRNQPQQNEHPARAIVLSERSEPKDFSSKHQYYFVAPSFFSGATETAGTPALATLSLKAARSFSCNSFHLSSDALICFESRPKTV
jgi:hypothetical protein